MSGFGGEYTQIEWLQIGIFLVGLPLAALFGASLGLVRRWKRGRLVTAALVGLGGAAATSIIWFGGFLLVVVMDGGNSSGSWLSYFDQHYSWQVTNTALNVSGVLSLLAGIVLRKSQSQQTPTSLSLRQLLLIQLFAFIALGCWTGMRTYSRSLASTFERASYKWSGKGWKVIENKASGTIGLERGFPDPTTDWKRENALLLEAVNEPWLGELHLNQLDLADELNIAAIRQAKHLRVLKLSYHPTKIPPEGHFDTVTKVSSLRELYVQGGNFSQSDVTQLERLDSLEKIELHDLTCDQATLRDTVRKLRLKHFALYPYRQENPLPNISYWQGYVALHRYRKEIDADDLSWVEPDWVTRLQIDGSELTMEAAQKISQMQNVEYIDLNCRVEGPALAAITKCAKLRHAFIVELAMPQNRTEFDLAVKDLLLMPKLKVIDCDWGVFKPELDYSKPIQQESRLESLGQPPPPLFNRPPTPEQIAFMARVNEQRRERGLGELKINPTDKERQQLLTE